MKTADHNPQEDFDILVSAWTRGNLHSFMSAHKYELMDRWYPITLRPAFWKTVESELSKEKLADALDAWFVNTGITDICTAAMGDQLVYLLIRKWWVFDWVSNDHSPFSIKIKNWLKKEGKEKILGLNIGINTERWWNRIFPPKEKIAATTNKEDDLEKFVRLWVKNPGLNVALNVADKNLDTWNLVTANPLFWKRLKEEMPISKLLETMSSWFGSSNTEISFPAMGRDLAISLIKNNVWMLSHVRNHKTDGDNFSRKIRNFLRKLGKEKTFSAFSHLFYPGVLEEFWEELFPEDNIKTSSGLLYTKEEYEEVLEIWELPYEEYLESIAGFKSGDIGLFPKYKDMSSSPLFWKALRSKLSLKELAQKMGSWFGSDTEKANPFVWGDELAKEFILRVGWALQWTASEWRDDPMARSLRLFIKKKMTKEEIGEAPASLGVYESVDELWEALFPKQEGRTASSKPKISSTLDLETQAEYSLMYLEAAWVDGDVEIAEFLEDNDWGAKETSDFLRRPGAVKAIKRLTSEGNEPYQRRRFLTILLSVVSRNPDMYVPLSQLDAIEVCYLYHVMARFFSLNVFNDLLISRVKARIRKLVKNKAEFRKTLIIYGISGRELEEDIFPENKTASSEEEFTNLVRIWKEPSVNTFYRIVNSEKSKKPIWSEITERKSFWDAVKNAPSLTSKMNWWYRDEFMTTNPSAWGKEIFTNWLQDSDWLLEFILANKGTDVFASKLWNYLKKFSQEEIDELYFRYKGWKGPLLIALREDKLKKEASAEAFKPHVTHILDYLKMIENSEGWGDAKLKKTPNGYDLEKVNSLLRTPGSFKALVEDIQHRNPTIDAAPLLVSRLIRSNVFVPLNQISDPMALLRALDAVLCNANNHLLYARIRNRIRKVVPKEEFLRLLRTSWGLSVSHSQEYMNKIYGEEKTASTHYSDDLDEVWEYIDDVFWGRYEKSDIKDPKLLGDVLRQPGTMVKIRERFQDDLGIYIRRMLFAYYREGLYIPLTQFNEDELLYAFINTMSYSGEEIPGLLPRLYLRISKTIPKPRFVAKLWNKWNTAISESILEKIYGKEKTSKYLQVPAPITNQIAFLVKEKLREVYKTDDPKQTLSQIRFRPYGFSLDEEEVKNMPNPKGDLHIETLIIRFLLDPEATPEHPLLVGGEYRTTSEKGQPVEAEIDLYVNGSLTYEELIHHTASLEDFEYSQHIIEHELIHLYDKTTREKREEKERTDREYYNQPQEVRAYRANLIKEFELWVYEHQPKELDSKLLDSFLRESKFWRLNKWLYPENRRAFLKELGRRLHEYSTRTKEMAYGVSD